jgi:hypothetical protein
MRDEISFSFIHPSALIPHPFKTMAHGSYKPNDRSLELGYQEDNVNVGTLIKFLVGLAIFTFVSFALMYGLKMALEYQAAEDDKANAQPMAAADPMSLDADGRGKPENQNLLPPEPRVQAAPGFGVAGPDGKWVSLENKAPQAEYWELKKQWDAALAEGVKQNGTVVAKPIDAAMEEYLKNVPVREGAKEEEGGVAASETSSGRVPGAKLMTREAAPEKKEGEAKTEEAKPAPTPAAKAAGEH